MKKRLFLLIITAIAFISGCKKDTDPIFDDPDTRLSAELSADMAKLVSAENGWKATIYPKGGKGFSYYFKFTADGKVTMLSDFNTTTATTPKEGYYRLKALQRPTLMFDTYNYIHLPADPDASISGGTSGTGLASDFEFAFVRTTPDSVIFQGTFNGNAMKMAKLTAAESTSILGGALKTMSDNNVAYVLANRNPYLTMPDGKKVALVIDATAKSLKFNYIDNSSNINSQAVTFAYGINKITLSKNLTYNTLTFNEIQFDPAAKVYYVMSGTTRYDVVNSPVPIIPLTYMFGFASSYTYRNITIPGTGLPAGVTSAFTSIYTTTQNNFVASGRSITSTVLTLTANDLLRVTVNYVSGTTAFVATVDYTMVRSGDTFTLSAPIYSANWTTRATQLLPLTNFLQSGPFKVDWVASSSPSVTSTLGGFYRVADATSFFYGIL